MKKSVIATSVIVVLGGLWLGGAWYTGNIAQQQYQHYIQNTNEELRTLLQDTGINAQIENPHFVRGLFSSAVDYEIRIQKAGEQTRTLPFAGKLYHGPLTINDFSFALFSSDVSMVKNASTQHWFSEQGNPLNTQMKMGYGGGITGNIASNLNFNEAGEHLTWQLKGTFESEPKGHHRFEMKWDNVLFNQENVLTLTGKNIVLKASGKAREKWKNLVTGESQLKAEQVKIDIASPNASVSALELNDFSSEGILTPNKEEMDFDFAYEYGGLRINQSEIGKMAFSSKWRHINADALDQLLDASISENSPLFEASWERILNDKFRINIDKWQVKNATGTVLSANLDLGLEKQALDNFKNSGDIFASFDTLDLNIKLEKPALQEYIAAILSIDKEITPEQAKAESESVIEDWFYNARKAKLFEENGEEATLSLSLDKENKLLIYNDQKFTQNEINTLLFLGTLKLN